MNWLIAILIGLAILGLLQLVNIFAEFEINCIKRELEQEKLEATPKE